MPLDERDLDLLSAYLDNALTTEERAQVDSRLAAEPDLRRELERLRLTSGLIGTLPTLRPPRPLILTRQMVTPRILIFPATVAFSAMSAAAAIIVLLVGVLLLSTGRDTQLATVANLATMTIEAQSQQTVELFAQDTQEEAADQFALTEVFNFAIPATMPAFTPTLTEALGEAAGAAAPVEPEQSIPLGSPIPPAVSTVTMDDGLADSALRQVESPTPEIAAMEIAPFAAQVITDTPSPFPTMAPPTATVLPTATDTSTPMLLPSPTPSPTDTPVPPQPAPIVQTGDGSSIGTALIVIAALLFGLSASAFFRRRG